MSSVTFLKVTPEAEIWRDLSPSQKRWDQSVRITLIVLGLITLAAMAGGISFCVPGIVDGYAMAGALMFAAFVIGLMVSGAFFAGAYFLDFEKIRNGCSPNFKKQRVIERHFKFLSQEELTAEKMYNKYYKNNGGLGPLVRIGLLSKKEGELFQNLFAAMVSSRKEPENRFLKDEINRQFEKIGQLEIINNQLC